MERINKEGKKIPSKFFVAVEYRARMQRQHMSACVRNSAIAEIELNEVTDSQADDDEVPTVCDVRENTISLSVAVAVVHLKRTVIYY